MSKTPSAIATLATGVVIDDLRVLFKSLAIFNPSPPTIYIFCDKAISAALPALKYPGKVVVKEALEAYAGLNRATMERMPGEKYSTRVFDFTMEKVELLKWVLQEEPDALFCDADICFLAPLPEIPRGVEVALSPHMIRPEDEARFGKYNAGFMWFSSLGAVSIWEKACKTSRFFEQAALEDVAISADGLFTFPVTQNYGWWRLWQGVEPSRTLFSKWSIKRTPTSAGIAISGVPLGSVHTHFFERNDMATKQFNDLVTDMLGHLKRAHHEPAVRIMSVLGRK
jgi:hypothetical protein